MFDEKPHPAPPTPLARSLGMLGVLFLTLSVTTPASSVFVIVPGMLQVAGTGAVWAMLISAVICVCTAVIYAELSSAWPVAGGEYVMVDQTIGPLAGFVMLGLNVFNNLLFPPVAALGISALLGTVVPGLPAIPVAIAVMAGSTLVALLNIRINAVVTGLFLLVEVAAMVVVVVLGFGHAVLPLSEMLLHPVMPAGGAMVPASTQSIGVATTIALFALNGYGAAVYFAEEMHEAPRLIARAVLIAAGLAIVLIALPLLALLAGAGDLHRVVTAEDPYGLLTATLASPRLAQAVALGVAIAVINAIIATVLAAARFFYSSARDGSWGQPLDRWLVAIHPRFGSPWLGSLLIGGIMILACFVPLRLLLVINGSGLVVIYGGMALAAIAARGRGSSDQAHYRMPLHPIAPVLTLAALAYVVWTSWQDLDQGRPGLIITAGQVAMSAAYYWFVLRRREGWGVRVPEG